MKDSINEWLFVFAHSTRAQFLVAIGVLLSLVVFVAGKLIAADFEISGTFAPLTPVFREHITDRYGSVALLILLVALGSAVRRMQKERQRLRNL